MDRLKWGIEASCETIRLVATFPMPDFEQDYEFVALHHPDEYAIFEGRLISNRGLDIAINEYDRHFTEEHMEHANALHSVHNNYGNYFVGPLARFNLNYPQLTPLAKEMSKEVGLDNGCKNPFQSILVRSIETLYAFEEALRVVEQYEMPDKPFIEIEPKPASGYGCSEAPRGICYHRYRVDGQGIVMDAKIVPPTSQNQRTIEKDLRHFVEKNMDLPKDKLTWHCEQAIRNYDPCISCATHFLKLEIERE
jgi:coenzyme F420-reducing hydrogenase alpha subunit